MPDIDWIRKLCLSFPDTTENMQWGEALCFKVRAKLFAIVDLSQGKLAPITLKCSPEKFAELLEVEGIEPAPCVGRYKWILLTSSSVWRPDELADLLRESYELVVAKAPKTKTVARKKPAAKRRRGT